MKVLIILIILFSSIQCLLISTVFVEIILNIYQIIGVSLLISYISWIFSDVIERHLLPNKPIEVNGRSVLITGCDSGFGYGSAHRLHAKGFHVLATVVSDDSEGAMSLKAKGITTIEMNVLDDKQISRALNIVVKSCDANRSELWAVVNNAGVYACGELEWGRIQDLETLVQINVFGYIKVIRTFLPLIRRSRGRIVNISSVAALFSAPGTTIYSMSKCAVSSVTDGLRRELYNKGVDVIEIQPQAYKNPMTDRIVKGLDECWKKTDEKVKNDFDEEYYQSFRSYISRNIDSCRDNAYEVVDTITNSVLLSRIRYKYLCCGLTDRLILWSFHWLPLELLEPIVSLFTVRRKPSWALRNDKK